MLHALHVAGVDDRRVAGGGDEHVGLGHPVLQRVDLVALHRGLQRVDRVDLRDDDPRALSAEALGAALAHVAVAADDRDLAGEHHVGGAVDGVDQRVAAAVEVVELRLRDAVVHVDGGEQQLALLRHAVEALHARRRLLGDALDAGRHARPLRRVGLERALEQAEHDGELGVVGRRRVGHLARPLELDALVQQQGRVAAVVEDHVRSVAVGPRHHLVGRPPVLLERLALPREHRHAVRRVDGSLGTHHHRRRRVVLRGEDVAARPAHLGAQLDQRLDQHGRLDRHVQRTRDARALQRLRLAVLAAQRAEAGHLVLGEVDLLAPEGGHRQVGDPPVASFSKRRHARSFSGRSPTVPHGAPSNRCPRAAQRQVRVSRAQRPDARRRRARHRRGWWTRRPA